MLHLIALSTARLSSSNPFPMAKRKEPGPSSCCVVCWEVLLDPISLPCGHSLDKACLERVIATAPLLPGRGRARAKRMPCCPTCRAPVPKPTPLVNVTIRDLVEEHYPEQVNPHCPTAFPRYRAVKAAR